MRALKIGTFLTLLLNSLLTAAPGLGAYTVRPGDSLWAIAARSDVYGDPWKWSLLKDANPVLIQDPDLIEPGWKLAVPLAPAPAEVAAAILFAQQYKEVPQVAMLPEAAVPPVAARSGPGWAWALGLGALLLALLAWALRGTRREAAVAAVEPPLPVVAPEPVQERPTESEAILRAEAGPDPLHPEDHQKAA